LKIIIKLIIFKKDQCNPQNSDECDDNAYCIDDRRLNTYVCRCKPGYEGSGLRGKCYQEDAPAQYLVYAQGASVHRLSLKNNGQLLNEESVQPYRNRLVYRQGQTAVGISYDCNEKFVYWSDVSGNTLNRIRVDGSQMQQLLENVTSAEGLAVDWISKNIYFTDSEAKTVEVASLNGKFRKILIRSNLNNPRGIAVDPVDGY
jgi:nidogen (entactin)